MKLFKSLLVAPAAIGLLAPFSSFAAADKGASRPKVAGATNKLLKSFIKIPHTIKVF